LASRAGMSLRMRRMRIVQRGFSQTVCGRLSQAFFLYSGDHRLIARPR
jgi:hypothetical protein